jgi:glycosyltransferase involved in cell wall biosynthesis
VAEKNLAHQRIRVAVLTNMILPYRRPVFEALVADLSLELRIFLSNPLAQSDPAARHSLPLRYSRGINLRHKTLHPQRGVIQEEGLPLPLSLPFDLLRFRPHLIISGEFGLRSLIAWASSRLLGVPLVLWSEEIEECAQNISGNQRRVREFLFPRAAAFLAWGTPAAAYLLSRKVPSEKIHLCAQAVDNDAWAARAASIDRDRTRMELGFAGKVFLAVGRLVQRKGFDLLLKAWNGLPQECKTKNRLVLVGSGEERDSLHELAARDRIPGIVFVDAQPAEELARYYAVADVFVFPSQVDVWGLVVNEAMACGLPVLASCFTGAGQGLVAGSGCGETFNPADIPYFTALLSRWGCETPKMIHNNPRRVVGIHNFELTSAAILNLIKTLVPPHNKSK